MKIDQLTFVNAFNFKKSYQKFVLKIGGLSLKLRTDEPAIFAFVKQRFAQFLSAESEADYVFDIFVSPDLSYHSPNPDESFFNRQEFTAEINFIYGNGYAGYLHKKSKIGRVVVSSNLAETWLEHFLRFAFSWLALENNCLFFHGAGIIKDHHGYVFFGPSKAGKTTVTEFSSQHLIVGDDMILISRNEKKYLVHATPFNINLDDKKLTNASESIEGFYRLRQDKENYAIEMKNSKAVAELLSCVPLSPNNVQGHLAAFSLCAKLAQRVPCYDLHFTRDNKFWRLIDEDFGKVPC